MDQTTLQRQAERLKACAAMGGFVVSLEEAERAVLEAEEDLHMQKTPTLLETLAEIRLSRQNMSSRAD